MFKFLKSVTLSIILFQTPFLYAQDPALSSSKQIRFPKFPVVLERGFGGTARFGGYEKITQSLRAKGFNVYCN